jgi:hypothetical protein
MEQEEEKENDGLTIECGMSNDTVFIPNIICNKIPYFSRMLASGMEESISNHMIKPDVDSETIYLVIRCYDCETIGSSMLPSEGTQLLLKLERIADQLLLEKITTALETKKTEAKLWLMNKKIILWNFNLRI